MYPLAPVTKTVSAIQGATTIVGKNPPNEILTHFFAAGSNIRGTTHLVGGYEMTEEGAPKNQLIMLGAGITVAGVVMVPIVYLLSQVVPEYSWSGLYLAICGVGLLGITLLGVGAGMATSGSTISHRAEDPGIISVKTADSVYLIPPNVQPPTVPQSLQSGEESQHSPQLSTNPSENPPL